MKNRRINRSLTLVLVMAFIMLFALSPDLVSATIYNPINLSSNPADTSGENWTWTQSSKTMTLNGVDVNCWGVFAIELPADSTIVFQGTNTVFSGSNTGGGIRCAGDLTITGTGVLSVIGYVAIVASNLTISGGTVTAICSAGNSIASITLPALYTWWSNTSTTDPGSVGTLSSTTPYSYSSSHRYIRIVEGAVDYGLIFDTTTTRFYYDVNGDLLLNSGDVEYTAQSSEWSWDQSTSTLNLNGFTYNVTGVYTALTIVGSGAMTINLSGTNTFSVDQVPGDGMTCGIELDSGIDLTITGNGTLNATGGSSAVYNSVTTQGIYIDTGKMTINSGTINATGGESGYISDGICLNVSSMKITGGTVNAAGGESVIDSSGVYSNDSDITISGGTLSATGVTATSGDSYGVFLDSASTLAITGSTLIASGQTTAINGAPNISALSKYTYWTSTSASDPGGNGTIVPTGTGYTWSIDHKYLKITTEITPGGGTTTTGGAAKTGDNSNMYAWSALALISVLGMCVLRKRRSAVK